MQTLESRSKEISLLMRYAVPQEQLPAALALLEKYSCDPVALQVFHNFYSYLPEGEEDAVRLLRQLAARQGTFLLCATTGLGHYLYLATGQEAAFLGPLRQGIQEEVLEFFSFRNGEEFLDRCRDPERFPVYVPAHLHTDLCPVCHVADGENHVLGCPVEICPWCGGQLTSCSCRFKLLGRDILHGERELDELLALLEKKGRVPFDAGEHRPAYPVTPGDLQD